MRQELTMPFIKSVQNIIQQMSGIVVEPEGSFFDENAELVSLGVATIIGFAGKIKGRLLLNMEPSLALAFANVMNGAEYASVREMMVLMSVSELNNIVAGDANTVLNNQFHLNLRLAPPVVFTGEKAIISIPKIASQSINCSTPHGKLNVNIAFEGSI